MRRFTFVTVDVFTNKPFGGNQLAVFTDARGLSEQEMQALAAEFNLSETTFVFPPENNAHTAKVRIFNRTYEMPFAGHPNVGTAFVLASEGRFPGDGFIFEELAGLVHVEIQRKADGAVAGARIEAPQPLDIGSKLPTASVAACVSLSEADLITVQHQPVVASMGHPFIIAEVAPMALGRAVPDAGAFRTVASQWPEFEGHPAIYLYAKIGLHLRSRMFSPLAGTHEDAATGSAAAPLCALLLSLGDEASASYEVLQGVEMGRPSLLRVQARRESGALRASLAGECVPMLRGEALL